jgi:hypothetical protein
MKERDEIDTEYYEEIREKYKIIPDPLKSWNQTYKGIVRIDSKMIRDDIALGEKSTIATNGGVKKVC